MSTVLSGRRRIIIDTDCGADDAQAIIMAVCSPHVQVEAILTVHGNTTVNNVCLNVLRSLKVCGEQALDIPIYKGCSTSLIGDHAKDAGYHGKDGLGDAEFFGSEEDEELAARVSKLPSEHAASALARLVESSDPADTLDLVVLGPMTNIAVALKLDPDLGKNINHCYLMGGNYKGRGNITPTSEFNFDCDPEAARVVLKDLECPKTLVTWELCEDNSLTWKQYDDLFSSKTKKVNFIRATEVNIIANFYKDKNYYTFCDQYAMAVALWGKDFAKKSIEKPVSVSVASGHRGQLVVDWWERHKDDPNWPTVEIVTEIDLKKFIKRVKLLLI